MMPSPALRPRKKGAKLTNKQIAPGEKIEILVLNCDGKRDRWKYIMHHPMQLL